MQAISIGIQLATLSTNIQNGEFEFGEKSNIGATKGEMTRLLANLRVEFHNLGFENVEISAIPSKIKNMKIGVTDEQLEKLYYTCVEAYRDQGLQFGKELTDALADYMEIASRTR